MATPRHRPLAAVLARLLVAGGLACCVGLPGVTLSGCASKTSMTKIDAPEAGITLGYDLSLGQTYTGHVRRSETVRDSLSGSSSTRSIAFDVNLLVLGPDADRGGSKVRARFRNIDLRWQLPPGFPISLSDFMNSAMATLQGLEVDFNVGDDGKILYMPPLPDNLGPELELLLRGVLDVLESSFQTVPSRPLKVGESWNDTRKRGREGKLGLYLTGETTTTVEGLFRDQDDESGEELARLKIVDKERSITTTKEGTHENTREGKVTSYFATKGAYLARSKGEYTEFDPGNSTTFIKLEVEWTKGQQAAAPAGAAGKETQSIVDPCDPDYVGGEECPGGAEIQSIADPCDPDYVGAEECLTEAQPGDPNPAE